MKRTKICLVLALIVLIGFTLSLGYVSGKDKPNKPQKPKKATEINLSLLYTDHDFHPTNYAVEGVAYTIYDGLNNVIGSGITDATGMITFIVLMAYDQTGLGIHVVFFWQGEEISINNLVIGESSEVVLSNFAFTVTFEWDDSSPIAGEYVEIWLNGFLVGTEMTDASGIIVMNGIVANYQYTFVSVGGIFTNIVYTVLVDSPSNIVVEIFTISAQFKRVSRFLVW